MTPLPSFRRRLPRARCRAATLVVALAGAVPCAAQTPRADSVRPTPARPLPELQNLRFAEDWSAAHTPAAPWTARVKHVPLGAPRVWVGVGGQLRTRVESVRGFGGVRGADDAFALHRAAAHVDLHAAALRLFVEGKHAIAGDRALPGGRRPSDENRAELQNAFAALEHRAAGRAVREAWLRVGRQEIAWGKERLLSPGDWANSRRAFQGARAQTTAAVPGAGLLTVDAFWLEPVAFRTQGRDRVDHGTDVRGASVERRARPGATLLQGYALDVRRDAAGTAPASDRRTFGVRLAQAPAPGLSVEAEGALQRGHVGAERVRAWFVASDVTWAAATGWRPTVGVGLDASSGDARAGDGVRGTFDQLFPLAHAYAGFADVLGRQNLAEARLVTTATAPRGLLRATTARLSLHAFARTARADAIYGTSGAPAFRPGTAAGRAVGAELDATLRRRIGRHLTLDGGGAHFRPAATLRRAAPTAAPATWAFVSTTLTF